MLKALCMIVSIVSAVLLPMQVVRADDAMPLLRIAWPDSAVSRLAALALLESLDADLLSHDSATLTLERWCDAHRLAAPPTIRAERVLGVDKPPGEEQRRLLGVGASEPLRYRRVRLACGAHVLSEADNWYVPARLTPEMNQVLDTSDVAFGRAVQALAFQRRTLSAELLWHPLPEGWEMAGIPAAARPRRARDSRRGAAPSCGPHPAGRYAVQRSDRNLLGRGPGLSGTGSVTRSRVPPGAPRRQTLPTIVEALNRGRNDEAAELCAAALARDPRDAALNELAAIAALRRGRAGEALAFARRSLETRPGHAATLIVSGRAALALDDDAGAVSAFAAAAKAAPERAEPAFLLCAALVDARDPAADPLLQRLAARFPHEAAGWEDLARSLLGVGRRAAAAKALVEASRATPGFRPAFNRGLILKDLGRAEDAAAAFAEALRHDADMARAWFLLGVSSADAGLRDAAVSAYRRALAIEPTLAEAAVNLGTLLQESGDLAGAKAAYGEALRLNPDTFGRIAQAMTTSPKGELWLDLAALRRDLIDA